MDFLKEIGDCKNPKQLKVVIEKIKNIVPKDSPDYNVLLNKHCEDASYKLAVREMDLMYKIAQLDNLVRQRKAESAKQLMPEIHRMMNGLGYSSYNEAFLPMEPLAKQSWWILYNC